MLVKESLDINICSQVVQAILIGLHSVKGVQSSNFVLEKDASLCIVPLSQLLIRVLIEKQEYVLNYQALYSSRHKSCFASNKLKVVKAYAALIKAILSVNIRRASAALLNLRVKEPLPVCVCCLYVLKNLDKLQEARLLISAFTPFVLINCLYSVQSNYFLLCLSCPVLNRCPNRIFNRLNLSRVCSIKSNSCVSIQDRAYKIILRIANLSNKGDSCILLFSLDFLTKQGNQLKLSLRTILYSVFKEAAS